ncbi:unnamed protein product [Trichogramma brassicae]|uniref:C2H2-type domain-containing protein n=1 Tax=Trichogramma brassicae TaxID=86971 RepID=A0A6H5ICN8_9HYME|nr:unnamed protein product [Trichogramma brassicae]
MHRLDVVFEITSSFKQISANVACSFYTELELNEIFAIFDKLRKNAKKAIFGILKKEKCNHSWITLNYQLDFNTQELQENELDDLEIELECMDMKPKLLAVAKIEDYSPNFRQHSDDYKTGSKIKLETVGTGKKEILTEQETDLNFGRRLSERNKKGSVSKKSNYKKSLKVYVGIVQSGINHTCDICQKTCSNKSNLRKHIDSVHRHPVHFHDFRHIFEASGRVKEEPGDVSLNKNNSEILPDDEKPDVKNLQLLPFPQENSKSHARVILLCFASICFLRPLLSENVFWHISHGCAILRYKKRRTTSFNQKSSITSAWTISRRNTRPYNSVKLTLSPAPSSRGTLQHAYYNKYTTWMSTRHLDNWRVHERRIARVRALIYRIQPPEPTTALKSREHAEKIAERGASSGQSDAFWTRSKKNEAKIPRYIYDADAGAFFCRISRSQNQSYHFK